MNPPNNEALSVWIKRAINLLAEKQISETMVLSSYKINTVLKQYMGVEFKVDRVGRALAKIAKQNKLRKIPTKIPKYEVKVSKFKGFLLPD